MALGGGASNSWNIILELELEPILDGVFLDLRPSALLPIRPTSTWF